MSRGLKDPTTAAIILAGGSSRRFGADNKLLASIDGVPLIRRVATRVLASRVGRVIVVTGHERALIAAALSDLDVTCVHNHRYLEGMGFTVAAGVAALDVSVRLVLITPGDLPELSPQLIDRLLAITDAAGGDRIVFPTLPSGEQRNPVVWPRAYFAELAALSGDKGARELIQRHAARTLPVPMEADTAFVDIDSPADLARWREQQRKQADASGGTP